MDLQLPFKLPVVNVDIHENVKAPVNILVTLLDGNSIIGNGVFTLPTSTSVTTLSVQLNPSSSSQSSQEDLLPGTQLPAIKVSISANFTSLPLNTLQTTSDEPSPITQRSSGFTSAPSMFSSPLPTASTGPPFSAAPLSQAPSASSTPLPLAPSSRLPNAPSRPVGIFDDGDDHEREVNCFDYFQN